MQAKKILNQDVRGLLISSLPTRPTAPRSQGGKGYGVSEMKAAFDKLPLYIIERYNELISDVTRSGDDSLAAAIPSGIKDGHSLYALFEDVRTGELATYFSFLGKSLLSHIITLYAEIGKLQQALEKTNTGEEENT